MDQSAIEQATSATLSPYAPKGITAEDIITLKLANPNLSLSQAAKILGCAKPTIVQHLHRVDTSWTELVPGLERYKARRADLLAHKGKTLLSGLTTDKQKDMSGLQLVTAFGILYDKERLERGQSTANIAYNDLTKSLAEIEAEIARLEGGGAVALESDEDLGKEVLPDDYPETDGAA